MRHGHDASACLVIEGEIVADVAEERFTRIKNDGSFPVNSISYCLEAGGITSEDLDAVAIPSLGISATIKTLFPGGVIESPVNPGKVKGGLSKKLDRSRRFLTSNKADDRLVLPVYMDTFPLRNNCKIIPIHHHLSHAASAYYTSGLYEEDTLIIVMDGAGDEVSTSLWKGYKSRIELLRSYDTTSSLGWFYSAVTEALGWRHGSDEWKTMGLAPYGNPGGHDLSEFYPVFSEGELIKPHQFGNVSRFPDHGCNHYHLDDAELIKEKLSKTKMEDLAAEAQRIVEEEAEKLIFSWLKKLNVRNLCCAGGFFLNVKLNQRVWQSGNVDTQWVYPNPGDSGLSVGAALYAYYNNNPKTESIKLNNMYKGPSFDNEDIVKILDERKIEYHYSENITGYVAGKLAENKIVAWFQGRMEAGPRALGHRSILMSPLYAENKNMINACVKYREAFRPFAPAILYDKAENYLMNFREEPFMITSFDVKPEKHNKIPAVVHVDGTSRPQTIRKEIDPLYYDLIQKFGEITGEFVLLNTSFNVKGEPIICTPREAIKCFYDTGLDILVMGNYVLEKSKMK